MLGSAFEDCALPAGGRYGRNTAAILGKAGSPEQAQVSQGMDLTSSPNASRAASIPRWLSRLSSTAAMPV